MNVLWLQSKLEPRKAEKLKSTLRREKAKRGECENENEKMRMRESKKVTARKQIKE